MQSPHQRPDSGTELPFDWMLNEVPGNSGSVVDYLLPEPAKCPRCFREVTEKALVEW